MGELIDYLLVFWACLGGLVLVAGRAWEQQRLAEQEARRKREARQRAAASPASQWTSNLDHHSAATNHQNYGRSYQQQVVSSQSSKTYSSQQASSDQSRYYNSGSNFEPPAARTGLAADGRPAQSASRAWLESAAGQDQARAEPGRLTSSIPTASGFNPDLVDWVNSILYLFYSQGHRYAAQIAESVCRSLNEKLSNITHSSSDHSHLAIEFTSLNCAASSRPELTNVRTELESERCISATCKLYSGRLAFELTVQRLYASPGQAGSPAAALQADFFGHNRADQYELVLEQLEGKLKSMAMLRDKLIVVQFMDKPDSKIQLRQLGGSQRLIGDDALVQIILQAITQVVVDLFFGDDADFPQYSQTGGSRSAAGQLRSKLSGFLRLGTSDLRRQLRDELFGSKEDTSRRVFVKLLRASNIDYNQGSTCLLELDWPRQQVVSSSQPASSNPSWEEHFLFQVSERTSELTVELWDGLPASQEAGQRHRAQPGAGAKFLGRARIAASLDELRRAPVQRLSVALEPASEARPGDPNSAVGGELALELLYLEHVGAASSRSATPSPTPSFLGAPVQRSSSASSLAAATAAAGSASYSPGDVVSVDRKLTPAGYVITTTTITKPRSRSRPGSLRAAGGAGSRSGRRAGAPARASAEDLRPRADDAESLATAAGQPATGGQATGGGAGAGAGGQLRRSRSRSLLRAIKKRFSFGSRSRSLGGDLNSNQDALGSGYLDDESSLRAGSATPASSGALAGPPSFPSGSGGQRQDQDQAQSGRAKSVPGELPTIVINRGGRGSESAANFSFAHPRSQLVVEVEEPTLERQLAGAGRQKTRTRHYAVPETASNKRKWTRKGTKLHLFNEHQFVACHLAGSATCHLCGRAFSRRLGKQGYRCRNCHLLSHKQCHVKVDHSCPYAAANELQLEFIDAEPPAELANELQPDRKRNSMRLASRSISLETGGDPA